MNKCKLVSLVLLVLVSGTIFSQTTGNIQLTNNGVAPVPIFSLGRPAVMTSAVIRKGKFYFNPEFNLGIDAKPWTIFSRVGYYLIENKKLTIVLAANLNWFFMQRKPMINNEEFQLQRYQTIELNGEYIPKKNQRLLFSYWRSDRLDKVGVLYEYFVNLAYSFDNIKLGETNLVNFKPSFFYLKDYSWVSGFFAAQTTSFQKQNWKCNLFLTTSFPITKMEGTDFVWNTGVNIPF